MNLALAIAACVMAAGAAAQDPRKSGYDFMSPATQAMQRDDTTAAQFDTTAAQFGRSLAFGHVERVDRKVCDALSRGFFRGALELCAHDRGDVDGLREHEARVVADVLVDAREIEIRRCVAIGAEERAALERCLALARAARDEAIMTRVAQRLRVIGAAR